MITVHWEFVGWCVLSGAEMTACGDTDTGKCEETRPDGAECEGAVTQCSVSVPGVRSLVHLTGKSKTERLLCVPCLRG